MADLLLADATERVLTVPFNPKARDQLGSRLSYGFKPRQPSQSTRET